MDHPDDLPGTERRRPDLADLDRRSSADLARLFASDTRDVAAVLDRAAPQVAAAIDRIAEHLASTGGRLVHVGAGTAGRIGVLDAAECGPTFDTDRAIGILAGGPSAMTEPAEDVEDRAGDARAALDRAGVGADDAVVGLSASGTTAWTVAAVRHARNAGAVTVGVASNPGTPLLAAAELPVVVPTGPELLAGSTRLKAGTAQKVVCNTLSTAVMVRLGKTYGDLMVDVRPTNDKLRARARRIVAAATGTDDAVAAEALRAADDDVKRAVVALLLEVEPAVAAAALADADGSVRAAVDAGRDQG